jgi:hypothetical protein
MRVIALSNDRRPVVVDDEDFRVLSGKSISIDKDGYPAIWHPERGKVTLHLYLLNFPGDPVDHINRNKLDNRRENLRVVDRSANNQNRQKFKGPASSQYVGVTKRGNRWAARIKKDGKSCALGRFDTERDAAIAYNGAARALYGTEASINEI